MEFKTNRRMQPLTNVYQVLIEVKGGDYSWGDYYEKDFEVGYFYEGEHDWLLEDLILTLDRMKSSTEYQNENTYYGVVGFSDWFMLDNAGNENFSPIGAVSHGLATNWIVDSYNNQAELVDYKVVYYDWYGMKQDVVVEY